MYIIYIYAFLALARKKTAQETQADISGYRKKFGSAFTLKLVWNTCFLKIRKNLAWGPYPSFLVQGRYFTALASIPRMQDNTRVPPVRLLPGYPAGIPGRVLRTRERVRVGPKTRRVFRAGYPGVPGHPVGTMSPWSESPDNSSRNPSKHIVEPMPEEGM